MPGLSFELVTCKATSFLAAYCAPSMCWTLDRMESWLGSYGLSLLGTSRTAGIGCKHRQRIRLRNTLRQQVPCVPVSRSVYLQIIFEQMPDHVGNLQQNQIQHNKYLECNALEDMMLPVVGSTHLTY